MSAPEVTREEQEFLKRMIDAARTSLASINGYSSLLADATSETEWQQYVMVIRTDTSRLVWAVNRVLRTFGLEIPSETQTADENPPAGACGGDPLALRRLTVKLINWLVLKKWPEHRWRWIPWLLLRLYAVALLVVALYVLLYQGTHGGFVDRPFEP